MRKSLFLAAAMLAALFIHAQTFDPVFNPVVATVVGPTRGILLDDGKYILSGTFVVAGTENKRGIARFNSDGTLDNSFLSGTGFTGTVYAIALQADGKIIVSGLLTTYDGETLQSDVIRLNADGTLDHTFSAGVKFYGSIHFRLKIQSDGKILVAGSVNTIAGQANPVELIRLNTDGSLDATFTPLNFTGSVWALDLQADGKIIAGGTFSAVSSTSLANIVRLNTNGSIDNSFVIGTGFNTPVYDVKVLAPDRILVGGSFTQYNGTTMNRIVALKADGTIDNTFNGNGNASDVVSNITLQSDGKIIIGGQFTTFDATAAPYLVRLLANGDLDTFATGTGMDTYPGQVVSNGVNEILVLGTRFFQNFDGEPRPASSVLNSDGSLKTTAFVQLYESSSPTKIVKQGSDKILVGHNSTYLNGVSEGFRRLNLDGSLDATFNAGPIDAPVLAMVIDGNDNIVIGGSFDNYDAVAVGGIAKLDADGNIDATFDTNTGSGFNGTVSIIEKQPDGKLLVGGNFSFFNGTSARNIARLNADGTRDNTFIDPAAGFAPIPGRSLALHVFKVLSNGKILVGGSFISFNGNAVKSLLRLNADGSFDNTFNIGTGLYESGNESAVNDIEVLDDGKLLIGGQFTHVNGVAADHCIRLNSDGTLDTTYPNNDLHIINEFARQDNGKILLFDRGNGLKRLTATGETDPTFVLVSGITSAQDILIFNKEIIIGGTLTRVADNAVAGFAKVVLPPDPAAPTALVATALSPASASLSWTDNATNEDGYFVERSLTDNSAYEVIATLDADVITYEDNALEENTTYYYRVTSFNASSENNYSNEETITTPLEPPAAPTTLGVNIVSSSQLALSWTDNSDDETGFEIERSEGDATNFQYLADADPNATAYTDEALTPGTVYYYRIRAVNGTYYSDFTDPVSGTPNIVAPSALTLEAPNNTTVILSWTDNSTEETEFIIKRSIGDELNYQLLTSLPADTETYEDTGLTPGTTYYYQVSAANTNSESLPVSGNIIPGKFNMKAGDFTLCETEFYDPGGTSNYANDLNVTTTLYPSTAGASIQVAFETFSTQFLFDALSIYDGTDVNAPLIGIFDSNDAPGTVRASNTDGALTFQFQSNSSTTSSGWRAVVSCVVIPFKPSAADVETVNNSHLKITWTDNSTNETGFVVERSVNGASSFEVVAELPPNATSYDDNAVASNTTFYYRIKAKGDAFDSDFAPMTAIAYGEGVWKLKADFDGIARTDATAFSIGEKGYLGLGWAGGAQANNFRAYDPATNTWSVIDSYGGSIRSEAASFVIGNKAYVGTGEGFDLENDLWEYDPVTTDWTAKADFGGTPRRDAVGFSIDGKGYFALGTDASGRTNDVWQYDPTGNAWTEVAPFPGTARTGAVAFVINNIAYVGSGSSATGNTSDFWKYDAGNNTWTAIAGLPGALRHAVAFSLNNKGYIGTGESSVEHKEFWEYDPATDTWDDVVSFGGSARFAATAFATTEHGYVATGFDGNERKDLWEFTKAEVPSAPEAPQQITATAVSYFQINLTWQYSSGNASGFVIERSANDESNYIEVASPPAGTTIYADKSLDASTLYYYRIKATTDLSGNSGYSLTVSATTLPPLPVVPSDLQVSNVTNTSLTLTWTSHSGASEYRVERSVGTDNNFEEVAIVSAGTYFDATLSSETRYFYRVRAMNASGFSEYSDTLMVDTPEAPVQAPSDLAAVVTSSSYVSLTWTDNANNETEFHVYRSVNNADNFVPLIILAFPDANSHIDIDLEEVTTYYYKVKAVAGVMESDFSNIVSVTTPFSIPAAPTELTAQLNEAETLTTLTWTDNADNESDFVIERSYDDGDFVEIVFTANTTYEDDQINEAIKRSYRVRARNAAGNSAYSNIASVTLTVEEPVTGIEENPFDKAVTVYPNPADDHIIVEFSAPETGTVQIELSDVSGKVISRETFKKTVTVFTQKINVRKPSGGLMLMKVLLNKSVTVKKVIFK